MSDTNYRLKIVDADGSATFFIRRDRRTSYISGSETPLALSNLLSGAAAEVRFQLEDALNGADAAKALRDALAKQWVNNKPRMPKVTVL